MEKRGGRSQHDVSITYPESRFAYLGNGEPPPPVTLQEQLQRLYDTPGPVTIFDGTLQHQIAESIRQTKGNKRG